MKAKRGMGVLMGAALALCGCTHRLPPPENRAEQGEYRLGREDVVEVSVWRDNDLSRVVPVRPDGKIAMPLVGELQAEGKTAPELAEEIRTKLGPFVENPRVTVIVREVNARKVFVLGEVQKPGSFPLRGDMTVLQALAQAGGLAQFADPDGIVLVREHDGKVERYNVKYSDMVDGNQNRAVFLSSGDTIYVP
jgi:polysaccharide export outer membrane protein